MGIEDDIKGIIGRLTLLEGSISDIWTGVKDLNEKVDLLTIRNKVADRQDKEKKIKDTIRGQLTDIDTNSETDTL